MTTQGFKGTAGRKCDAIYSAIARRDEFIDRVKRCEGDAMRCADLMVEAINLQYEANGTRASADIAKIAAAHCMFAARDAYLRAKALGDDAL